MPVSDEQKAAAEAQIVEQSRKIDFYLTEYTVEFLALKMRDEEFIIPSYQREDTWEDARKSRFIESLLMGLPIPFLFFWERPDTGKLEIVDGSQRLRTMRQFVLEGFELGELDTLTELEGMRFDDLSGPRQRKIKNKSVRGIVLNEHADEQARFEIFDRINTGSKIANKAEVRRGALTGPFLDLVIELADYPVFAELAPVTDKSLKLREREELITRFFAYSDGLAGYADRPSEFLFEYAKKQNGALAADPDLGAEFKDRFHRTLAFVAETFPHGFRKTPTATTTRRARFEAIAVGSFLALAKRPKLAKKPPDVTGWISGPEFEGIVRSDSANVIKKLEGRIHYVRDKLLGG